MEAVALTDRAVAAIEPVKGRQQIIRDSDLSGFFVVVGARSKTFMIQADLRTADGRQSIRMKIGEAGRIAAREARGKAKLLLGQIADGIDPRPKPPAAPVAPPNDPTLDIAWSSCRSSHLERKGRSDKTVRGHADHVERLLADWLDTRLSKLGDDPSLVKAKHDALTAKHGPFMANSCMRTFRAVYNHARKSARILPAENPVFAVDWNPEKRRDTGLGQVAGINEVDMHLLMNHSLPGVNAGYITRAKLVNSHLRLAQQTLSDSIAGCATFSGSRCHVWPHSSGKHVEFVELPPKQSAVRGNGLQKCSRNLAVFRKAA